MVFTDAERETLKNNTKQIEEYIRTTICPNLRESVNIPFGNFTTRRGPYGWPVREKQFELHVRKDWLGASSGGLGLRFSKDEVRDSTAYVYGRGWGDEFMYALCHEWLDLKMYLNTAVAKQKSVREEISNFVL